MNTIRMGSKGPDVVAWQKIIGVTPDGDFGPKTRAATIAWQKAHHLDPDGVVGPKTWAAAGKHGGAPHPGNGGGGGGADPGDKPPPPGGLVYPLFQPALAPYSTGARFFGAPRANGRLHAADDLLAPFKSKIRAIADGVVLQPPYYFYLGTNALEVHHPGVGTVRYGEISQVKSIPWKTGDKVKCGQVIAYVGLLDTGSSMIHFELYSGKASGSLTQTWNPPYQRRSDLVNPAHLVDKLYKLTFGH